MGRVILSVFSGAFIFFATGCSKNADQAASSINDQQDARKTDPSKDVIPTASLKVGDPAPALKVTNWLQGDAVETFELGKVYVVEFWATWCGAPIRYMPHLAELQARYKDRGDRKSVV